MQKKTHLCKLLAILLIFIISMSSYLAVWMCSMNSYSIRGLLTKEEKSSTSYREVWLVQEDQVSEDKQ